VAKPSRGGAKEG